MAESAISPILRTMPTYESEKATSVTTTSSPPKVTKWGEITDFSDANFQFLSTLAKDVDDLARIFAEGRIGSAQTNSDSSTQSEKISPVNTSQQASESARLDDITNALISNGIKNLIKTDERPEGVAVNDAQPEIDSIEVTFNKKKGVIDSFVTLLKFYVPRSKLNKVKAFRIFRAAIKDEYLANGVKQLTMTGLERISSESNRNSAKDGDNILEVNLRMQEAGMRTALSTLNPIDPLTNLRTEASLGSELLQPTAIINQAASSVVVKDLESFINPQMLESIDRSVANDINSLRNLQVSNPAFVPEVEVESNKIGQLSNIMGSSRLGDAQIKQIKDSLGSNSGFTINENNSIEFEEIAFFSPSSMNKTVRSEVVEFYFEDPSVLYARLYQYYVATVDYNMYESLRSKIVQIPILEQKIPPIPSVVATVVENSVSLTISTTDYMTEKFEIYACIDDALYDDGSQELVGVIGSMSGFNKTMDIRTRISNGFIQIGEAFNNGGGATFIHRNLILGSFIKYRIFSVNIFGFKSEGAAECSVVVSNVVNLSKPTILVEIDRTTRKVKVSFFVSDNRVTAFFLSRRDVTIGQRDFAIPRNEAICKISPQTGKNVSNVSSSPSYNSDDLSIAWQGYYPNYGENISFIDFSTEVDHSYQYRVYGIDRFGNQTPVEISKAIFVSRVPLLSTPGNLAASPIFDSFSNLLGVSLKWKDMNSNFSIEELVGNQDSLTSNSSRMMFQVERLGYSDNKWLSFPMVETESFFDYARADLVGSTSRTLNKTGVSFVVPNDMYYYRVASFLSGGYISNFSEPLLVTTTIPVLSPINFMLEASDVKIKPIYVMLNWGTDSRSSAVDKWVIDRAAVNNLAASTTKDVSNLNFKQLTVVFRESSRFASSELDRFGSMSGMMKILPAGALGQHFFMDSSVNLGNTYHYRIKAVSPTGVESSYVYKSIKMTSESFEDTIGDDKTQDEMNEEMNNGRESTTRQDPALPGYTGGGKFPRPLVPPKGTRTPTLPRLPDSGPKAPGVPVNPMRPPSNPSPPIVNPPYIPLIPPVRVILPPVPNPIKGGTGGGGLM